MEKRQSAQVESALEKEWEEEKQDWEQRQVLILCCCCSVAKLCLTLQPHGLQHSRLSVLHYLPEFAQICIH